MELPPSTIATAPSSLIYRPTSYVEPLDLGYIFPKNQPLDVELGSGDGSFLVEWARRHPDQNFLGVERLLGRIRKLNRKALRAGLTHLRCLRLEASYVVEYLLPPASVRALHIYFPDPWPKRKQRKHRLINSRFTEVAARVIAPGGSVHLRTDDADYFAQMTEVFAANPFFRPEDTPVDMIGLLTDFERGFQARGVPTLRVSYRRE
jgi:tRNA (guanine-N7-)-methyltransferase